MYIVPLKIPWGTAKAARASLRPGRPESLAGPAARGRPPRAPCGARHRKRRPGPKRCRVQVRLRAGASRPPVRGLGGEPSCADTEAPREGFEGTCFPWVLLCSPGNGPPGCTSQTRGVILDTPFSSPSSDAGRSGVPSTRPPVSVAAPVSLCTVGPAAPPARPGRLLLLPPTFSSLCWANPAGAEETDLESNPI